MRYWTTWDTPTRKSRSKLCRQSACERGFSSLAVWIQLLVAMFAAGISSVNGRVVADEDASPQLHALLIGCSKYDSIKSLIGPDNDVAMTAATLSAPPYSIPKARLTKLTSSEAAEALPTRRNIIREFESLRNSVKRGDQAFILIAGHGTRVVNDNPDTDWEPDGLDEVFLPVDASFKTAAESGIRDDLIGDFLDDLQEKGAFVCLVVDSCFSGTMARGPFADELGVASRLINDSSNSISAANVAASDEGGLLHREFPPSENVKSPSLVVLYAGPPGKVIKEQSILGRNWHGRLSWKLNQVLNSSSTPLTYRELEQQIRWEFANEKWIPMPWLTGTSPDRTFLGVTEYPDRSRITLAKSRDGGFTIDAGVLQNMYEGSVLEVSPLVGNEARNSSPSRVRVTESHPLFSYVENVTGEAGSLSVPGRCALVERGIPEHRLKIAIAEEETVHSEIAKKHKNALYSALKTVIERNKSLLMSARIDAADFILIHRRGQYSLETPDSLVARESPLRSTRLGPFDFGSADQINSVDRLECQLTSAARALLLRRLAINEAESTENGGFQALVELHRQRKGQDAWSNLSGVGETLGEGDIVRVQVTNIDTRAFDVNMLYIDSAFSISSFFPSEKKVMANRWATRLEPGQQTPTVRFEISTDSVGLEDLLILLTSSTGGKGSHFLALEQAGINDCSPGHATEKRSIENNTKLGALLRELLFSTTDRRSIPLTNLRELAIRRLSWYVQGDAGVESP